MAKKICPVMSRPVVLDTQVGVNIDMYWVSCEEDNCPWWDEHSKKCSPKLDLGTVYIRNEPV